MWLILVNYLIWEEKFTYTVLFCGYYQKADAGNGEVVRASVRLKTDVCPECGRTYISGGETTTQIRYVNETNPYQKDLKESDKSKYQGANVDIDAG